MNSWMSGLLMFPLKGSPRTLSALRSYCSMWFYKIPTSRLSFGTDGAEIPTQIAVNVQVILYLIDKLNTDKSPGPDGTHSRAVKELKGEIGELLAKTCKCSSQRDTVLERAAVPPQGTLGTSTVRLAVKTGKWSKYRIKRSSASKS